MEQRMSDLITEFRTADGSLPTHSPAHYETEKHGFKITNSTYEDKAYSTVTVGNIIDLSPNSRRKLIQCLSELLNNHSEESPKGAVLVVGLGNSAITADSLGPITASRIAVTDRVLFEMGFPKICAIIPGVPARTGLDTAQTVLHIAKQMSADLIIAVDSLCAVSPERLGNVIQISEAGISPGSAFSHTSGEISKMTMPCPVISLGVPTVIRASSLSPSVPDTSLLVSPADLDIVADCYASIIAGGINSALLGNRSVSGIIASYDA
ncbi:MAG: GPR endopeptidase [Ruminococcaceae bacterium]|nr:GPR endopeptidase [Oscillospiraceae bacterium]